MSLESAKAFYVKLATDAAFRSQFENTAEVDERRKFLQATDYDFMQEEFEAVTAQILESESVDSELSELNEEKLAAVVGGAVSSMLDVYQPIRAIYGAVQSPYKKRRWPIDPQPMYGVPIS